MQFQSSNAPKSLSGSRQSIFFFAKQIFPIRGTQKLEDGCLSIRTFKSGDLVQEEHFGATEFVRGLCLSFTSTSNSAASTAGAGKTVLSCVPCRFIVHLLMIVI
jgi:hypothetical protein